MVIRELPEKPESHLKSLQKIPPNENTIGKGKPCPDIWPLRLALPNPRGRACQIQGAGRYLNDAKKKQKASPPGPPPGKARGTRYSAWERPPTAHPLDKGTGQGPKRPGHAPKPPAPSPGSFGAPCPPFIPCNPSLAGCYYDLKRKTRPPQWLFGDWVATRVKRSAWRLCLGGIGHKAWAREAWLLTHGAHDTWARPWKRHLKKDT
jgi:hypothetical protein